MSGLFTPIAKNLMLDAIGAVTASLHTENPTEDGSVGELAGGSYARKGLTYQAAADGTRSASALPTFDIPAGTSISHFALWAGGNCISTGSLPNPESYTGEGKYTLTSADLTLSDA